VLQVIMFRLGCDYCYIQYTKKYHIVEGINILNILTKMLIIVDFPGICPLNVYMLGFLKLLDATKIVI
jgi:hypothetical protein